MNAKKKIASSIFTMFSMILITILAIILPISVQNAQKDAMANAYNSYGVAASVSGNYYIGNNSYKMMSGDKDKIVFASEDAESCPALDVGDISLSSRNDYTIFEYRFENDSEDVSFVTNISNIVESSNIELKYGYSYKKLSSYESVNIDNLESVPVVAGSNEELYIYIKVKIIDLNKSALLSGTFCFDLVADEVYEVYLIDGKISNKTYAAFGYKPCKVDVPEYQGLKFKGYYTMPGGFGKQIFDENGEANQVWAQAEGDVLYAHYGIA